MLIHADAACTATAACASSPGHGVGLCVGAALLLLMIADGDMAELGRSARHGMRFLKRLARHPKVSHEMTNRKLMKLKTTISTLLCAGAVLSGCATSPTATLNDAEWHAIKEAEQFVLRHGYTPTGHPADKPIVSADVTDNLRSNQQKAAARRNRLEARAACLIRIDEDKQYVLFRRVMDREEFGAVYVADAKAVQVMHQQLHPDPRCIWL